MAKFVGRSVVIDGRDLGAPKFAATGDVFICASKNIQQKAGDRNEQLVHIPVGINPDELDVDCRNVRTPSDPFLLFVGDIAKRKGVPELLDAYASEQREEP
jgi:glycosyltransferase involved in cell wall biosynthesis